MSNISDYQNRTFDILAFQPSGGSAELAQTLANDSSSGLICTGIQKLSQRWVLEFLTPVGSMPYIAARGSSFMANVRAGRVRNNVDVLSFFSIAASEVGTNLINEDATSDPDDERYSSASLQGFSINTDGKLVLDVIILSAAGTARKVIFPINVSAGLI